MPFRFVRGSLNIPEGLSQGFLDYCGLQRREAVDRQELQAGVLIRVVHRFGGHLSGGQICSQRRSRIFQTSCNGLEQDGSKQRLLI